MHGVGFAVNNALVTQLTEIPVGISERLMTLRVKLVDSRQATMISAYAPTLDATDEDKEMFYSQLDTILTAIPDSENIFLLGDFNARVGRSADVWTGVVGRHGVGNVNDNGILLLSKCAEHRLLITNTTFRLKDKHKTSWMHPRSKHWHLLDYVIIRQRDQADVFSTRGNGWLYSLLHRPQTNPGQSWNPHCTETSETADLQKKTGCWQTQGLGNKQPVQGGFTRKATLETRR